MVQPPNEAARDEEALTMRRKGLVWLAAFAGLILGLATTGVALGQGEPLPTVYSGDALIQGAPAPQGATLVACVQNCGV